MATEARKTQAEPARQEAAREAAVRDAAPAPAELERRPVAEQPQAARAPAAKSALVGEAVVASGAVALPTAAPEQAAPAIRLRGAQNLAATDRADAERLTGCWRVPAGLGVDTLQVAPRIVRREGERLVVALAPDAREATVTRAADGRLTGTLGTTAFAASPAPCP